MPGQKLPTENDNNNAAEHIEEGSSSSCYCGVANEVSRNGSYDDRIVGGRPSLPSEYPWQVTLLSRGHGSLRSRHFCGGALVSSRHVVTAAHCTQGQASGHVRVGLGLTHLGPGHQHQSLIIGVRKIIQHPNYKGAGTRYEDDIAVLVLRRPVSLTRHPHIKPVCLPFSGDIGQHVGRTAVVSGWGLDNELGGQYPDQLHSVSVSMMADCGHLTGIVSNTTVLCAGHDQGGRDACQGDSGGGLVLNDDHGWSLVGVVSVGRGCGRPGYPGVYTDVARYIQSGWLTDIIKDTATCPPKTPITSTTTMTPPSSSYDVVLVIGGSGYSYGSAVEAWSPDPRCTATLPSLPDQRTNHDSAMLDGQPITCGGDLTPSSCLVLGQDLVWRPYMGTAAARSHHMMVSYGPGVLTLGGHLSNTVEYMFNASSEVLGGSVPTMDMSCGVLTDENTILITGGVSQPGQCWQFDLDTGDWRQCPDVPDGGRYKHACSFVSRDGMRGVMVAGGTDGTRLQRSAFFYNMDSKSWVRLKDLPEPRWGSRLVNVEGDTFILGGGDGHRFLTKIYKFDFAKLSWAPTKTDLQFPRTDFSVVVVPGGCTLDVP